MLDEENPDVKHIKDFWNFTQLKSILFRPHEKCLLYFQIEKLVNFQIFIRFENFPPKDKKGLIS